MLGGDTLKNLIILPDGTELSPGDAGENTINSTTLTEMVNSGEELALGSTCANILKISIKDYANLSLTAGDEVVLYKVDGSGNRVKKGIFILEKPTRPSPNILKLTGYDRITKLDKDLTSWLNGLTDWPYTLTVFAKMVCEACGLTYVDTDVPNGDFLVYQFTKSSVTGRQIMKWLGEICCRFCRANADGEIEFAWYKPSGVTIAHTGDRYYFQGALSYETYQVAPIEAVQLRLADSSNGALWPEAEEGANSYIISGNAILMARVTEELEPYLQVIKEALADVTYTPCQVSTPACVDVDAGSIVNIIDKNGAEITAYVMTKVTSGQKDTLECTGSARRDSATPANNQTEAEKTAKMENYASSAAGDAAKKAVDGQTSADILNKLTDNGKIQGIYVQDSKWYINAEAVKILNLTADDIDATNLKVSAANITGTLTAAQIDATDLKVKAANITGTLTASQIDATNLKVAAANITGTITAGKILVKDSNGYTLLSAGDNAVTVAGWKADNNSFYSGDTFSTAECFFCTGSNSAFSIGGSGSISGWVLKAGSNLGVTKAGALYASDAHIQGKVTATSGKIGDWNIGKKTIVQGASTLYSGSAIYSDEYTEGSYAIITTLTPTGVYIQWRNSSDSDVYYASWMAIVTYITNNT